jgi:hypothetical protein
MKRIFTLTITLLLLIAFVVPAAAAAPKSVYMTFSIVSVKPDNSVTIQTYNMPPNDTFNVTMGAIGTRGVNGIKVDTISSGNGGSQTLTFKIPTALYGTYQIAIRMQSPVSGVFAYNWFYNTKSGTGGTPPSGLPYGTYPTFSIVSVKTDKNVTIQTYNLPANDTFNVTMGPMGTQGINGIKVDTVNSGNGGSKQYTFKIPSSLYGLYQIAIRMQSPTSGYFAYNWFYNNSSGTGGQPTGPSYGLAPGTFPTFSIVGVVRDKNVTIQTYNLSSNDTYVVTMGPMGTRGINGIQVDTVNTGNGGSKQYTFKIPSSLYGSYQIAIRMQSSKSGYFAFNWFYNNTYP